MSGVPDLRNGMRISGRPDIRKSGVPDLRIRERMSGRPDIRREKEECYSPRGRASSGSMMGMPSRIG
jgi:hypothetical protein